jgi:hypothetical protein
MSLFALWACLMPVLAILKEFDSLTRQECRPPAGITRTDPESA